MNEEEREESSEDFEDFRARPKRSKALGGTSSAAAARNAHQSLIGIINFVCCFVTIVLMFNLNLRIYRFLGFASRLLVAQWKLWPSSLHVILKFYHVEWRNGSCGLLVGLMFCSFNCCSLRLYRNLRLVFFNYC